MSIRDIHAPLNPATSSQKVKHAAWRLGFDAVRIAKVEPPLSQDYLRYENYLDLGYHGNMAYMAKNRELRQALNTDGILTGAKSVICLARSYKRRGDLQDRGLSVYFARYARGKDYHVVVRRKIRKLAEFLRSQGSVEHPVQARPMVDDVPVLERAWAKRAGLGFIGKNGMLIVPGVGSYVFLGEVVTTLELEEDTPINERCGRCSRCMDLCPTKAFPKPYVLDARKCVSYLNIEKRDEFTDEDRKNASHSLFGCDVCQAVCPFNASANVHGQDTNPFEPHFRWNNMELLDVLRLKEEDWGIFKQQSPVSRLSYHEMIRNACLFAASLLMASKIEDAEKKLLFSELNRIAFFSNMPTSVREAALWSIRQAAT